jgi:anthranilate phosphoribosyltransferase
VPINNQEIIDTCGTGGDNSSTFNISTTVAIITAAAGGKLAKHGNVSVSSHCGSADVLKALGVKIELSPESVAECIKKTNIGFIFAPLFHPAMKYATPVRKELGIRTIFNILGPLTNPAGANYQILGVYSTDLVELVCNTLKILQKKQALVVHGLDDNCDEISIVGKTKIAQLKDNNIKIYYITPEDFGLKRAKLSEIQTKNIKENTQVILDILKAKEKGPKYDVVLLNAGFALYISNIVSTPNQGIELADRILKSHKAYDTLQKLISVSNSLN